MEKGFSENDKKMFKIQNIIDLVESTYDEIKSYADCGEITTDQTDTLQEWHKILLPVIAYLHECKRELGKNILEQINKKQ